jgi:hypothetical protein
MGYWADRNAESRAICARAYISEIEVAIGKLKRCKSPGADQSPAELIQARWGDIAF